MNKFVKGSIAAGVGFVLLLGGAGTFALWNQTATVADTSVSSGVLTLSASTGTWNSNPALWVPGDSYTYSTNLTVTATGDNLHAKLTVDQGSITGNAALKAALTVSLAVTPTSGVTATSTAGVYEVTPAAGSYTVPVVVTVTFPSSIAGTTAQSGTVSLTGINFKLEQHL